MFQSVQEYLQDADYTRIRRLMIIWIVTAISCLLVIMMIGRSYRNYYVRALQTLNKQRGDAGALIERNERVMQQQAYVQQILERDPSFKIKEFFNGVVQSQGMQPSKPAEVSTPQNLGNGYEEVRLEASFVNITMQQLVELLYTIEKNERMYAKDLVITQPKQGTIDATLVVATLQPHDRLS